MALRTGVRLTPSFCASSSTFNRSPGFISELTMAWRKALVNGIDGAFSLDFGEFHGWAYSQDSAMHRICKVKNFRCLMGGGPRVTPIPDLFAPCYQWVAAMGG